MTLVSGVQVGPGCTQTETGTIPEQWEIRTLATLGCNVVDCDHSTPAWTSGGVIVIRNQNIRNGNLDLSESSFTDEEHFVERTRRAVPSHGDLVITREAPMGQICMIPPGLKCCLGQRMVLLQFVTGAVDPLYVLYAIQGAKVQRYISIAGGTGSTVSNLRIPVIKWIPIPTPPRSEQSAVAAALSDADELLARLDRLIAKKRDLKQAAMQQLLTGRTRLPDFHGAWETKAIADSADCFDNVRLPINEAQRASRKGIYPYCGANGVLDYVDGYVIDDDIILIAEDGGYFDEYETRPIAYRMTGKCWINNHAHVLKAKSAVDQGFLFYSLVHKNILPYLASGTRAKLNRSEMDKIELDLPKDKAEQEAIAAILSDLDSDLATLKARRDKTLDLKQAMMQELLTGRIRLV